MKKVSEIVRFFKETQKFMQESGFHRMSFQSMDEVVFYDKNGQEFKAESYQEGSKPRKTFDRINLRYVRFLENDEYTIS